MSCVIVFGTLTCLGCGKVAQKHPSQCCSACIGGGGRSTNGGAVDDEPPAKRVKAGAGYGNFDAW